MPNDGIVCDEFTASFASLGQVFARFCESLPKKECRWKLTSGPLHAHITVRSMFASAQNSNSFPVNI